MQMQANCRCVYIHTSCTYTKIPVWFLPHGHRLLLFLCVFPPLCPESKSGNTFCWTHSWHKQQASVRRPRSAPWGTPLPTPGQASQMSQDVLMESATSFIKTHSRSWDPSPIFFSAGMNTKKRWRVPQCGQRHLDILIKASCKRRRSSTEAENDFLACVIKSVHYLKSKDLIWNVINFPVF